MKRLAFVLLIAFSFHAQANCPDDILGRWDVTKTRLNPTLPWENFGMIFWDFQKNGRVKMVMDSEESYTCEGDVITINSLFPAKLKILTKKPGEMEIELNGGKDGYAIVVKKSGRSSPVAFSGSASGGVYKWVDENGRTHYGASPPSNAEVKKLGRPDPVDEVQAEQELMAAIQQQRKASGVAVPSSPAVSSSSSTNNSCKDLLYGKWQVVYTSTELHKDKAKEEMPNFWTFSRDGQVAISMGGFLNLNERFHCEGSVIHIDRGVPSAFEVHKLETNELVWWDKDPGKYFYLEKSAETTAAAKPDEKQWVKDKTEEFIKATDERVQTDHRDADETVELDCDKAVFNAKGHIDFMLDVGKQNVDAGYADRAKYEKTAIELNKAKARISKRECASAAGDIKHFYECVQDDYNEFAMCSDKYKYMSVKFLGKR